MILHGNYKSSNTSTQTFFPLLRKILLILDRRNKSAHLRTCFTSCLNQFSCNLVDQKLICRGSHHYGHFNKPCIKEYILYTVLCGFLICFYLSLYAGINTAILSYVPISLQSVPFTTHTHKTYSHSLKKILSHGNYHKRKQPCSESPCCAQYSSKMKTKCIKH